MEIPSGIENAWPMAAEEAPFVWGGNGPCGGSGRDLMMPLVLPEFHSQNLAWVAGSAQSVGLGGPNTACSHPRAQNARARRQPTPLGHQTAAFAIIQPTLSH